VKGLTRLSILMLFALPAHAAEPADAYPSKPIRIIASGPGSSSDFLSRFIGQKLAEKWGQQVVVENRAGAGGTIGTDAAAKAAPDGYTLVMGNGGTFAVVVSLYKNLPYDPVRDFTPITLVSSMTMALVVNPSVPVSNVQGLIAYAKQKGNLNYASTGNGTLSHLTGELFKQLTGLNIQHVPYKSGAALIAIMSGEAQVSFLSPMTASTQLKSGKLKALAVSSRTRSPGAPDVPSAAEAGIPDWEAELWYGLFTTAKTPRSIVTKLNREVVNILRNPDVEDAILKQGAVAAPSTPEELATLLKRELAKWPPIIKAAGVKAD
jgi:tripartite-type tricarboxylate transporter receptor subunit TctC